MMNILLFLQVKYNIQHFIRHLINILLTSYSLYPSSTAGFGVIVVARRRLRAHSFNLTTIQ